jgi:hypothetical protein
MFSVEEIQQEVCCRKLSKQGLDNAVAKAFLK